MLKKKELLAEQSGGGKINNENKNEEENSLGGESDETTEDFPEYESMWEEIFTTIGLLPIDCPCKAYSKALYKRCVLENKPRRGLRPKHANDCTKIVTRLD